MSEGGSDPVTGTRLEPPGSRWPSLVRVPAQDNVSRATRRALGLVTDRPVIMSGHQPGFWHAGILAKWLAVAALTSRAEAAGAWVVPDQSPGAGATLEYPARDGEKLVRRSIRFGADDAPPAAQPPATFERPEDAAVEPVARGLALAAELLLAHRREPTLARQLHAACLDAIAALGLASARHRPVSFFASNLHETEAFGELVGAMRTDPLACARLYNEAARAQPGAGVRELAISPEAVELPLWERTSTPQRPGPWRTLTSDRLADTPDERLALRALPMTGLLRRWACDLFIHGTGGGGDAGYDRVTESWLAAWLGTRELAPTVVATATLHVDFGGASGLDLPTPGEIAHARDLAHRAEHDPALLGREELGRRKRELAEQIASLPRADERRAELFRRMQELRSPGDSESAGRLEQLRARAESLAARADEAALAADRTWPFLCHSAQALAALRDAITARLAPPAG